MSQILFERNETVLSNREPESLQATAAKIVFEYGFLFDTFKEENVVAFDALGLPSNHAFYQNVNV